MKSPGDSELLDRVRTVLDPCSIAMGNPTDIWEMGLVEELELVGTRARVRLILTDTSCVHYRDLRRHITDALLGLPGVEDVEIGLADDAVWTPDRMRKTIPFGKTTSVEE